MSPWLRARGFGLNPLAWVLLAYLMRDTLDLVSDYLRYSIFEFTSASPPDWAEL